MLKLLYYCSRLQHILHCLTNSAGQPGVVEVPLVPPHLPHDAMAQRAVRIRDKKPFLSMSSCTLIHTKGTYVLFGSGKLPLLKHQTWIFEVADEFLIPTSPSLSQGLFVILDDSLLLSMLRGEVSCMAARMLEKPVALIWLLGSVSPYKPCGGGYFV